MSRSRRHFVLAVLLLCSTAVGARGENGAVSVAELHRLDYLYDRRTDAGMLDEVIATVQRWLESYPENYDLTWRLARAWSWRGYTTDDPTERQRAAENALAVGRRAMTLAPDRVEGYFTYAIASGVYANAVGVAQAFVRRVGPDFERAMKRAYEIDRHFDDGSPMVALGRYYYELPWPLRDLAQSARLLEEATASHPDSARGHLYLAETYHALDRPLDARREIDAVLHTTSTDAGAAALVQVARRNLQRWYREPMLTVASDE